MDLLYLPKIKTTLIRMTVESKKIDNNFFESVRIKCPLCKIGKIIKIPTNIINESRHLTTISVPSNFICEHSFQVYLDKNFAVRGYQNVDFDFSNIEFYSESENLSDGETIFNYNFSAKIRKTIRQLREFFYVKGIIGGMILDEEGNLIYSSLPSQMIYNIIKDIDLHERLISKIQELILVLDDEQKVFSKILKIENVKLALILCFSPEIDLNAGNYYLREVNTIIRNLDQEPKVEKTFRREIQKVVAATEQEELEPEPGYYWLYSTINPNNYNSESDKIPLHNLGITVSKSVILNLKEIEKTLTTRVFEGKIYINDRYVKLMEGLAWTLKDASIFMKHLNRIQL